MIPKKAKDFIKLTAQKTNQSEDLVKAIINFYWKTIREEIVSMEHLNISVANLGTFKVKHWKIDDVINKYNNKIKKFDGDFKYFNSKKKLEDRIAVLENIKKQVEENKIKFETIKKKRDEQSKNNMEK